MKIQVFPLQFESSQRIGIRPLSFDTSFPRLMKEIPGNRWTEAEGYWHIPYHKAAYSKLKRLFGEGQIEVLKERPKAKGKRSVEKTIGPNLTYKD